MYITPWSMFVVHFFMYVEFAAMELDEVEGGAEIQAELLKMTGQRTVPNIFIKGTFHSVTTISKFHRLFPCFTFSFPLSISLFFPCFSALHTRRATPRRLRWCNESLCRRKSTEDVGVIIGRKNSIDECSLSRLVWSTCIEVLSSAIEYNINVHRTLFTSRFLLLVIMY